MRAFIFAAWLCLCVVAVPSQAWDGAGHRLVATAAARSLPTTLPAFLREGTGALGHYATDPDVLSSPAAGPLRAHERPDHWLDLEYLRGRTLPKERAEYLALLAELEVKPAHAGAAPYRIVEDTWALAVAFAEHRRSPDDALLRAKVLARAGTLSHFTADVAQPLHTTIHWDGRAGKDGRSPRTGEHLKMDALLWHGGALPTVTPVEVADVHARALTTLRAAHARVDRVYALADKLPGWQKRAPLKGALRTLADERGRDAVQLTADLWFTAWRMSARIELPGWYESPTTTTPAG